MARIEKTVFISYRRKDVSWALAVYQYLTSRNYDVFFDYINLSGGDFEHVIISNIKARAHFVLVLTPTALDRCNQPNDWLRREIETAVDEKRNIIPLFFEDFSFSSPSVAEKLTGKLANIQKYNGLEVPAGYFMEAMERLRTRYFNIPITAVLQPIPSEVLKKVKEAQIAADKALVEQKEGIRELIGPAKGKISLLRYIGIGVGSLLIAGLLFWGVNSLIQNLGRGKVPTPTLTTQPPATVKATSAPPTPSGPAPTDTATAVSPTVETELGVGSTMAAPKDGMTLLYVPAGDFTMGTTGNEEDERPVHTVYLDAFYIDKTEVTNAMYALCVADGRCEEPRAITSITRNEQTDNFYYGKPVFDDYPVIFVSWNDAKAYCKWVDRRLPTEAEWEKAASWDDDKKEKRLYPWGKTIDCSYANYYGNGANLCIGDTTAVGSYPAGASFYGILDMAGNVKEWVADRYDPEYYGKSDTRNPTGPASGDYIIIRGGSFLTGRAVGNRSSDREFLPPDNASHNVGFRCAMDASE